MAIESTANPGNEPQAPRAAGLLAGTAPDASRARLAFERRFTQAGVDPFDAVEWELRDAVIANERGEKVFEQVAIAPVGLGGVGEAGVLAHRPAPLAVTLGVETAGEGEGAGRADRGGVERGEVAGAVARRER